MTPQPDRYYRAAGAVPFAGTLLMLGAGTVAAVVLSFVYGLIDRYNPFIYFTFIATLCLGGGIGMAVRWGAEVGRVRNRGFVSLVGLVMGAVGLYFAWVWFVWMFSDWQLLVIDPSSFLFLIPELAEEGVWDIRGTTPTGWALYAIWLIEAAAVIIPAIMMAGDDQRPYCESCANWTEAVEETAILKTTDQNELRQKLEDEQYEALDELCSPDVNLADHLQASIHRCPNCDDSTYLTISHVTVSQKGDDTDVNADEFVKHLWIPSDVADQVKRLDQQLNELMEVLQQEATNSDEETSAEDATPESE